MEEAQCNDTYNTMEDDEAEPLDKKDTGNLTKNKFIEFELDNKDAILAIESKCL